MFNQENFEQPKAAPIPTTEKQKEGMYVAKYETVESVKDLLSKTEKRYDAAVARYESGDKGDHEFLVNHLDELKKASADLSMKIALTEPLDIQGHEAKQDVLLRREKLEELGLFKNKLN